MDFSGGHLAGTTQGLEDQGLIKIISKQKLETDCWKYYCKTIAQGNLSLK